MTRSPRSRDATHQVEWSPDAEADLLGILHWIDEPENQERVLLAIVAKADGLATLPGRGRVVPELGDQGVTDWREVFQGPWRIMYRIRERTVLVTGVIDGRRDVNDLLREREARP